MLNDPQPLVAWAEQAGAYALPLYAGLLLLMLLLCGTGWWLLQRYQVLREESSLPPALFLLVRMAAGFAVIVAAAWVFAELAEALGANANLGLADQALADSLRLHLPVAVAQAAAWLTVLANTETMTAICILVAAALVWRGRRWLALGWVLAVAGNGVLNTTLKQIFARVRPLHDDGLVMAQGYSFPSGHSSGSVVVYGMLAYVLARFLPRRWHLPLVLVAVALAFSIGTSRVFLRVHFASDVLAGFASGTVWLAVCIASIELTQWYRRRRPR
ncbi:MAG: phosphatase PAP2 family protein [Burkholderiales bacterium]|nr:phosphatase PAP2 family protein [Burkholderiales bacterium]